MAQKKLMKLQIDRVNMIPRLVQNAKWQVMFLKQLSSMSNSFILQCGRCQAITMANPSKSSLWKYISFTNIQPWNKFMPSIKKSKARKLKEEYQSASLKRGTETC